MNEAIEAVIAERKRQDAKWGVQNHGPDGWLAILVEEVGEVAKAILEGRGLDYLDELTQVAAVAVAAMECAKRGNLEIGSLVKAQRELAALRKSEEELRRKTMMKIKDLQYALGTAELRNPDAYKIIAMVVGYPEKRVREIAEGKGKKPSISEIIVLSAQVVS